MRPYNSSPCTAGQTKKIGHSAPFVGRFGTRPSHGGNRGSNRGWLSYPADAGVKRRRTEGLHERSECIDPLGTSGLSLGKLAL